ncbi:hypothetical protein I4U23_022296 [Adineta vaga]|nr:hypothetical protein I4U23_022296 [Adineta vaga]
MIYADRVVKGQLGNNVRMFETKFGAIKFRLRDRQGKEQFALPHRRHRPAKLPLTDVTDRGRSSITDVTDRLNDPVIELTYRLNDPITDVTDSVTTPSQRYRQTQRAYVEGAGAVEGSLFTF